MEDLTSRRRLLRIGAALASIPITHSVLAADDFPNRTLRWIVPTAPSGGTDFVARLLGSKIVEVLRQQVVVDNRAGASGILGMEIAAKAPADGYSTVVLSVTPFLSALAQRNSGFDMSRDFTAVSLLATSPVMLVAHPSMNNITLPQLVAAAKAQPGKLNYASAGAGSITHLAGELFKRRADVNIVHVPYKGTGPAVNDLLAGHVQLGFATPSSVLQYIRAGRLQPVAVARERRIAVAPEVPTFVEGGVPDVFVDIWYGMLAPAGTPSSTVDALSRALSSVLGNAEVREKMAVEGSEPIGTTPAEFKAYLAAESDKWTRLFKDIDFKMQ
jgi:tripartite-type tricarboxylate transporter receptor subunit TctC